jgi:hypothetical protein
LFIKKNVLKIYFLHFGFFFVIVLLHNKQHEKRRRRKCSLRIMQTKGGRKEEDKTQKNGSRNERNDVSQIVREETRKEKRF